MAQIHSSRSGEGRGGHRDSSEMVRPGNFDGEMWKFSRQVIDLWIVATEQRERSVCDGLWQGSAQLFVLPQVQECDQLQQQQQQ